MKLKKALTSLSKKSIVSNILKEPLIFPDPDKVFYSLKRPSGGLKCNVSNGHKVEKGSVLASSPFECLHASISGTIETTKDSISISSLTNSYDIKKPDFSPKKTNNFVISDYLTYIGAVGMGGSMFPASIKAQKSLGTVQTLIINGVDCEPGVSIDKALLYHYPQYITKGAEFLAEMLNISQIKLAIMKNKTIEQALKKLYPFPFVLMHHSYPAGAEKLIIGKLKKKIPPAGFYPFNFGYLIHNTATLFSIGKALLDNTPFVIRPVSLWIPHVQLYQNLLLPIGTRIQDILNYFRFFFNKEDQLLIASGLMMGKPVSPEYAIEKGTTSLFVIKKEEIIFNERDCVRCGRCFDACPLGLHPIFIVEKIRSKTIASGVFQSQLTECFLCGKCSEVCPSAISLAQTIKGGKNVYR